MYLCGFRKRKQKQGVKKGTKQALIFLIISLWFIKQVVLISELKFTLSLSIRWGSGNAVASQWNCPVVRLHMRIRSNSMWRQAVSRHVEDRKDEVGLHCTCRTCPSLHY
ncbi:hypothetical protein WN943_014160 [Citrus x changshan-huyou]